MVVVKLFSGKEGHIDRRRGINCTGSEVVCTTFALSRKIKHYAEAGIFPAFQDAAGNKLTESEAFSMLREEQSDFALRVVMLVLVVALILGAIATGIHL